MRRKPIDFGKDRMRVLDHLRKIKIWWLPNDLDFDGHCELSWNSGEMREAMIIRTKKGNGSLLFEYMLCGKSIAGGSRAFNYPVAVSRTPCHFGGYRNWFLCPIVAEGRTCSRRVALLYLHEGLFGCRRCHALTYASRNLWGLEKKFRHALKYGDLDCMKSALKRKTYAGKITKKQQNHLSFERRAVADYIGVLSHFHDSIQKLKDDESEKTSQK